MSEGGGKRKRKEGLSGAVKGVQIKKWWRIERGNMEKGRGKRGKIDIKW